jgi:hypothetical protein
LPGKKMRRVVPFKEEFRIYLKTRKEGRVMP